MFVFLTVGEGSGFALLLYVQHIDFNGANCRTYYHLLRYDTVISRSVHSPHSIARKLQWYHGTTVSAYPWSMQLSLQGSGALMRVILTIQTVNIGTAIASAAAV